MTLIPPPLIEPIDVTIEQIDKTNTRYSGGVSGRREKKNHTVYKAPVTIPAQVVFGSQGQETKFSTLGPDEQVAGYLVVRFVDLDAKGIKLKRGDKITSLLENDLFLLHSTNKPAAQFSSLGAFALARVPFGDRNPIGS